MIPGIKKILYATDLKEEECRADFRMAVKLAMCNDAKLVVLHVMEPISSVMEGMLRNSMSDDELQQFKDDGIANLKQTLQKRIEDFCDKECPNDDHSYPGGEPEILVRQGIADEVILDQAKAHEADVIVMGTRTHTGIGQLLLGSVANKVIHHSKIPVVVYPLQ